MSVFLTAPMPKIHSSIDDEEARFLVRRRGTKAAAAPDPAKKTWMDSFTGHVYMCQYKNRITTSGVDCPIKAAQACNTILGRPATTNSELTGEDWKQGVEILRSYFFAPRPNGRLVIPSLESLPHEGDEK